MNLFPTQTPNNVFVVVETLELSSLDGKPYNIIAVVRSYDLAFKYLGPNRNIVGPFPLVGDELPVKSFDFYPPEKIHFGDTKFDFDKPKFDFGKSTSDFNFTDPKFEPMDLGNDN